MLVDLILSRYSRRNPLAILRLLLVDLCCLLFFKRKTKHTRVLRRVLVANPAHLGDALITTGVLRKFKQSQPDVEVDILCGTWARSVFKICPGVSQIFCIDTVQANRSSANWFGKLKQYRATCRDVKSKLLARDYDAIFMVYGFEPSLVPAVVPELKNVPIFGYISSGYGPIMQKGYSFEKNGCHEAQSQAKVFEDWIGSPDPNELNYRPWLSALESERLPKGLAEHEYVIIHPGTGSYAKEWNKHGWISVIRHLSMLGAKIVISGQGEREQVIANEIIADANVPVTCLVNQIAFAQFCKLVSMARLLVCVDSVAGHIASAYQTPSVVICSGTSDIGRWRPLSNNVKVVTNPVNCSPCYTRHCVERPCITRVSHDNVIDIIGEILS